ncbi:hypothetical protein PoMZ_07692 [Pyricularia oryzae]|uniref:Uncharacterized protein n=1 Tax=Pyricularia oryzae TaxID=318829 RepID=A0A4P7NFU2_PYROR|nr:hypothetical protein PoMZ_07692 [Pyricularia oryzae]
MIGTRRAMATDPGLDRSVCLLPRLPYNHPRNTTATDVLSLIFFLSFFFFSKNSEHIIKDLVHKK